MKLRGIKEDPPKSGVFRIRYRDQDGRDRSEWVEGVEAAQARLKLRLKQVAEGTFAPEVLGRWKPDEVKVPRASAATRLMKDIIEEVAAEAKLTISSWKDDERYARIWKDELGTRTIDEVTIEDVKRWRRRRIEQDKVKPATVNRAVSFLRKVFSHAVECGYVQRNILATSRRKGASSVMLDENNEREQVLTVEAQRQIRPHMSEAAFAIVCLFIETGLRSGNLFGLRREWVDLQAAVIRIPRGSFKGRRVHLVRLNTMAVDILRRILASHKSEWVFPARQQTSTTGHLDGNAWLKRQFYPAFEAAGVEKIHVHDLRATCATRMLEAGATLEEVRQQLGHGSLEMVQRYARIVEGHRNLAMERMADVTRGLMAEAVVRPVKQPSGKSGSDSGSDKVVPIGKARRGKAKSA